MGSIPSVGTITFNRASFHSYHHCLFRAFLSADAEETNAVTVAETEAKATKALNTGLALMRKADAAKMVEERIAKYRRALEQFDAALTERADFCPPQAAAVHCLSQLAELTPAADAHRDLVEQAGQRFEAATKCGDMPARTYGSWAALVISESRHAPETVRHRAMLERAVTLLQAGLRQAKSDDERAPLLYQLGRAELHQARITFDRAGKRALYESALTRFQTASGTDSVAQTPQLYASWGVALVELGSVRNDRMLWRQAIERLQIALEMDPDNLRVRYRLVCASALLGQTENAMRHLRQCLDNDDANHTYFNAARQDPDLDSLRANPEFNAIFNAAPAPPPADSFEKPMFSDR